jgi:hypothetical protein
LACRGPERGPPDSPTAIGTLRAVPGTTPQTAWAAGVRSLLCSRGRVGVGARLANVSRVALPPSRPSPAARGKGTSAGREKEESAGEVREPGGVAEAMRLPGSAPSSACGGGLGWGTLGESVSSSAAPIPAFPRYAGEGDKRCAGNGNKRWVR